MTLSGQNNILFQPDAVAKSAIHPVVALGLVLTSTFLTKQPILDSRTPKKEEEVEHEVEHVTHEDIAVAVVCGDRPAFF